MATQSLPFLTEDEYLAIEENAEVKSEYYKGEMFAMAGASFRHNRLMSHLWRLLDRQLDGKPCELMGSDMRVRISATGLNTYPDLSVVCGEPNIDRDTLLNPTLIVEVLSPSTEGYDRGKKFDHYQKIESLAEYVIVAQDRVQVSVHARQPDGRWMISSATSLEESIELAAIGCSIPLGILYEKVQFDNEPPLH